MKLLFDQNLSPKRAERLSALYPGSRHVQSEGLDRAKDEQIWEYAKNNGFAIVTRDADYNNLSVVRGAPPRVIWLLMGNCTTARIEALFRARVADVERFERDPSLGTLAIG